MNGFDRFLGGLNAVLWHDSVLFALLGTGILFTVWSGFSQYRALTHGFHVLRGAYDDRNDPGAINPFQALSAALSATVGLGNIGGVALAIALGGPGAVFWMWVVGLFGMALKTTEVTLSMLYRNTDDPDNPHGGPMWVISRGLARHGPGAGRAGRVLGVLFCLTVIISAITGGNMFQAWNVADLTQEYFGVPGIVSGIILATLTGMVIIGGIRRIGAVTGRLVPVMIAIYLLGAIYVLIVNWQTIPEVFRLIFVSAFSTAEATGAFIGGTMGYAFLFGMKRALFSNEAGQGSSPIAHSAAKTREPARQGILAGLEPFLDTLVVCTITALVILSTGIWNRSAEAVLMDVPPVIQLDDGGWQMEATPAPPRIGADWTRGTRVFVVLEAHPNPQSGNSLHRLDGTLVQDPDGDWLIEWNGFSSPVEPRLADAGIYVTYVGATLTAKAFDAVEPGMGKWLITAAVWLFAFSTIISWSYYGEQGIVFMAGERWVMPYKLAYCTLIIVATAGFLTTDAQLDNLTGVGTGVMLVVNVPIMWMFGHQAMRAYREYVGRLRRGEVGPGHAPPSLEDLISGRDVR
ncbi:MAG: sodium:alanine symporter family protein [Chromatiales bacterium]|nr:sodium:alanine symporter family protein [Chromatiales bacterium]